MSADARAFFAMVQRFLDTYSRRGLAARWGVSRQLLIHWAKGGRPVVAGSQALVPVGVPSQLTLEKIARIEGCRPEDVAAGLPEPDGSHRDFIAVRLARALASVVAVDWNRTESPTERARKLESLAALAQGVESTGRWQGDDKLVTLSTVSHGLVFGNWVELLGVSEGTYVETVEDGTVWESEIAVDDVGRIDLGERRRRTHAREA